MAHQRLAALRTSGGGMAPVGALEQGRFADLLAAVRLGHDLNSQRNGATGVLCKQGFCWGCNLRKR